MRLFTKLCLVWHKARSMERLVRINLNKNGLFVYLANHYTTRSAPETVVNINKEQLVTP